MMDLLQLEAFSSCVLSTKVFSQSFMPERFSRQFSLLHDQIFKLIDDDSEQRVAIAAPRGFGKTTVCTIAYPAKKIAFQQKKFILPVSATATSAVTQGENLKRELLSNNDFTHVFGPVKSDSFSKDQWVTKNGVMVMPRGAGQQVRGLLFHQYRPDLIVVDDLDTSEGVQSEEQRQKLKDWFFSDLCNCVDRASKNWKIVVIGTVLHEDSLLVNLLDDPEWTSVRLEICDDSLESNWPDFISTEEIKKLHAGFKERGQLDVFYREYRNIPVSTEDATFKPEYFKYYKETDEDFVKTKPALEGVVIVDPAKTVKLHSADSAIVGFGVDRKGRGIYVRDVVSGKLYPDEMYNEMFAMLKRLNAHTLAIEVTSLNEFIVQPIKNEMQKRGIFVNLIELKARANKADRIAQLVPYYRQGYLFHNESCCQKLESQLIAFPRSRLWDVMDAAAYIIEVLELNLDYFDPPELDDKDIEAEYKDLDNEEAIDACMV
jgi:predicted phage terminase large subunit-like protein